MPCACRCAACEGRTSTPAGADPWTPQGKAVSSNPWLSPLMKGGFQLRSAALEVMLVRSNPEHAASSSTLADVRMLVACPALVLEV